MGARYGHNPRTKNLGNTEDFQCLDIRELRKKGLLVEEESRNWLISSEQHPSGVPLNVFILVVSMRRPQPQFIKAIYFNWGGHTGEQVIPITARSGRFGGHRWFFQCPLTKRRCERLYFVSGKFMSRQAARLSYRCQSEGYADRLLRQKAKVERRLNGDSARGRARTGSRSACSRC